MKLFTTIRETLVSSLGVTVKNETQPVLKHLSRPLIPVTPGEWFDRVTILEIKVYKLRGDKQAAVMSQLTELRESPRGQQLQYLRQSQAQLKALVVSLLTANAQLWDIEDKIRALDGEIFPLDKCETHGVGLNSACEHVLDDEVKAYLELARSVYVTNDQRSHWKREIDKLFEVQSEVKEYADYGQANKAD